ncbi:MAG: hypothetical protein KDD33_09455 [Bdellovibrionales bacterium]|nr:hypothetical protein [Bdellovibrionales bacterium]
MGQNLKSFFKNSLSAIALFLFFALPGWYLHSFPKAQTAELIMNQRERVPASMMTPPTQQCRKMRRIKWKCERVDGQRQCERDGYTRVQHCEPIGG